LSLRARGRECRRVRRDAARVRTRAFAAARCRRRARAGPRRAARRGRRSHPGARHVPLLRERADLPASPRSASQPRGVIRAVRRRGAWARVPSGARSRARARRFPVLRPRGADADLGPDGDARSGCFSASARLRRPRCSLPSGPHLPEPDFRPAWAVQIRGLGVIRQFGAELPNFLLPSSARLFGLRPIFEISFASSTAVSEAWPPPSPAPRPETAGHCRPLQTRRRTAIGDNRKGI
jgi:hypothetical protein